MLSLMSLRAKEYIKCQKYVRHVDSRLECQLVGITQRKQCILLWQNLPTRCCFFGSVRLSTRACTYTQTHAHKHTDCKQNQFKLAYKIKMGKPNEWGRQTRHWEILSDYQDWIWWANQKLKPQRCIFISHNSKSQFVFSQLDPIIQTIVNHKFQECCLKPKWWVKGLCTLWQALSDHGVIAEPFLS